MAHLFLGGFSIVGCIIVASSEPRLYVPGAETKVSDWVSHGFDHLPHLVPYFFSLSTVNDQVINAFFACSTKSAFLGWGVFILASDEEVSVNDPN